MSDPLSVAASITGLIALAGQLYNALDGFISNVRDAPSLAQTIQFEIKSFRNSLNALHGVLQNPAFCRNKRASLIPADYVIVSFTDAVLVFSQLETNVIPLTKFTDFGVVARMQWTRKKVKLNELVGRLQWQKQTLVLQLNILRCASDIEAERDRQVLDTLICGRRGKDRDMERRLELVEQQLQLQVTASIRDRRSSIISTDTTDSDNLTIRAENSDPSDEPLTPNTTYQHAFEELLNSSWVYRRNKNREEDMSMRSSVLRLSAWSVLSDMSLANISVIAVMSLPVQLQELCNGGWYSATSDSTFGGTESGSDVPGSSSSTNVAVDDEMYDDDLDPSTREAIRQWDQLPADRSKTQRNSTQADLSHRYTPAPVTVEDKEYDTDDEFKTTWPKAAPKRTSHDVSHQHKNIVADRVPSTDDFDTRGLMPGTAAQFDTLKAQIDASLSLNEATKRYSYHHDRGLPKLKLDFDQTPVFDPGWQVVGQAGEGVQTNQLPQEDIDIPEEVRAPVDKPAKASPPKVDRASQPLKSILKTSTKDAAPEAGRLEEPTKEERKPPEEVAFSVSNDSTRTYEGLRNELGLEKDSDEEDILYPESPMDEEDMVYPCKGCGEILEEGKAFELAGNRWHIDCFRCNSCATLLDSDANLLLLGDGSLICNNCTYSCTACGEKIEDLAILTGDKAYCAKCFKCRNCKRKIENLRYARTSQGIFCMDCHNAIMARRRKRRRAEKGKGRAPAQEGEEQGQNATQATDYTTDDEAAGTMRRGRWAPPNSPTSGHPNGVPYTKELDPIEDGISI